MINTAGHCWPPAVLASDGHVIKYNLDRRYYDPRSDTHTAQLYSTKVVVTLRITVSFKAVLDRLWRSIYAPSPRASPDTRVLSARAGSASGPARSGHGDPVDVESGQVTVLLIGNCFIN